MGIAFVLGDIWDWLERLTGDMSSYRIVLLIS